LATIAELAAVLGLSRAESVPSLTRRFSDGLSTDAKIRKQKTEDDARRLAEIQGTTKLFDQSFPQPYNYLPPPSWIDEDE
jgi:hypothetical protein